MEGVKARKVCGAGRNGRDPRCGRCSARQMPYQVTWPALDHINLVGVDLVWCDFLPKFLVFQFMRPANVYFLVICLLQTWNEVTITSGRPWLCRLRSS